MLAISFAVLICSSAITSRTHVAWIFTTREHRPGDNDPITSTRVAPLNVKTTLNVKTAKCEKPNNR